MNQTICQNCKRKVNQTAFCSDCGAPIPPPKPSIWAQLPTGAKAVVIIIAVGVMMTCVKIMNQDSRPSPSNTSKESVTPSKPSPPASSASSKPTNEITPAERIAGAKNQLKGTPSVATLRGLRASLLMVPGSAPESKEADALIKQLEARIQKQKAIEAVGLRQTLADRFVRVVAAENPYINFITSKLVKEKGGYALYAVHSIFTSSSFEIGNDVHVVQGWINSNRSELDEAGIVRVGFANKSGYLGRCWLDLK